MESGRGSEVENEKEEGKEENESGGENEDKGR